MKKTIFKMNPNSIVGPEQGYDQTKTQSFTCDKGDQHARSSATFMKKIISKSIPNPLPVQARDIAKPNLIHPQVHKGSSILDPHPK